MASLTLGITDISRAMTIDDVIQMVLQDGVRDTGDHVLFYVKGNREKRMKSTDHLHEVLAQTKSILRLTVKRRFKGKTKRSTVYKAKKTLMRLKNLFVREDAGRQNNLNVTATKNRNKTHEILSKRPRGRLSDIENLLHSRTMLITEVCEAEVKGKVELFRRFMNDINESMSLMQDTCLNDETYIERYSDSTRMSSEFNQAFMHDPVERHCPNNAVLQTSTIQDTILDQDVTNLLPNDCTDVFNECLVFSESHNMSGSELSESVFGDDNDVEDLERNVFDEDFESNAERIRNLFDRACALSTDDAIDSFMNTVACVQDHDEGLSSLGSDFTGEYIFM